jgi:hypothetical protein
MPRGVVPPGQHSRISEPTQHTIYVLRYAEMRSAHDSEIRTYHLQ